MPFFGKGGRGGGSLPRCKRVQWLTSKQTCIVRQVAHTHTHTHTHTQTLKAVLVGSLMSTSVSDNFVLGRQFKSLLSV